jgi:hemolysin activation/secretion protein
VAFRFVAKTLALVSLSMLFAPTTWAIGGRESMDRPSARPLPLPQYPPPSLGQDITLPPVPGAKIPIGDGRKISIRRILLEGNTVFPEQDLKAMIQGYENRMVTVAELEELRQQLTRYYIDHGYINSGAIIPADALKDKELRIQIIEGRLEEVRVNGQKRLREGYIKNRLQS